ncbi:unnamed protein product [Rhodiola kirilowii]
MKKASPLHSVTESLAKEKSAEGVTAEIPQPVTVDSTPQVRPQTKVNPTIPSDSANIPVVEKSVLNEEVSMEVEKVASMEDDASRAVSGGRTVGVETSTSELGGDNRNRETGKAEAVDKASSAVIEKESVKIVEEKEPSKVAGGSGTWREKIFATGYIPPKAGRRKKVKRASDSPRKYLAQIYATRGRKIAMSDEETEKFIKSSGKRNLVISDADPSENQVAISEEGSGLHDEAMAEEINPSGETDVLKESGADVLEG